MCQFYINNNNNNNNNNFYNVKPVLVYIERRQANIYHNAVPKFSYSWILFITSEVSVITEILRGRVQ
jgi:hypothetical protein